MGTSTTNQSTTRAAKSTPDPIRTPPVTSVTRRGEVVQVEARDTGGARCVVESDVAGVTTVGVSSSATADRAARSAIRSARRARPPAGDHASGHVLGQQRERQVVAPVAVDVEVPAQQAFLPEAEPLHEPLAGQVLRPDVGLD